MSFAGLLVHRLLVERRASGTDRLGAPHERWTTVASNVPCRLTRAKGGERNTERMSETYDVSHELFLLPANQGTLREDDQVTVTTQDGLTLLTDARVVLKRPVYGAGGAMHHVEVLVESLRGPQ